MVKSTVEILQAAGFKPRKPLVEKSRNKLVGSLGVRLPTQLHSFYRECNGGRFAAYRCRFFSLAEAIETIDCFVFAQSFSYLPILVDEDSESDPCVVGLSGPLKGMVWFHPHDDDKRMLAPNFNAFAKSLVKSAPEGLRLENAEFAFPRESTSADQKVMDSVKSWCERKDLDGEEAELLEMLVSSMRPSEMSELEKLMNAPIDDALVARCIRILAKSGVHAEPDPQYGLRVGPRKLPVNVKSFYTSQHEKGFEKLLVKRMADLLR